MEGGGRMVEMPTDVQFKHELRKQLTYLKNKLEVLREGYYKRLEKEYLEEIADIEASLQD